jgi:hypothetical protein
MIDSDWLVQQYPPRYAHLPLYLVVGTFEPGQLGMSHWSFFLCVLGASKRSLCRPFSPALPTGSGRGVEAPPQHHSL